MQSIIVLPGNPVVITARRYWGSKLYRCGVGMDMVVHAGTQYSQPDAIDIFEGIGADQHDQFGPWPQPIEIHLPTEQNPTIRAEAAGGNPGAFAIVYFDQERPTVRAVGLRAFPMMGT